MTALDMILAMGREELLSFLWLSLILDVPRYFLAALILAIVFPAERGMASDRTVTGVVACHNEEHSIRACIESMKANGVQQIFVVNDGSTDRTHDIAVAAGAIVIDLPQRMSKALAINVALPYCKGEALLIADADTVFEPGSVSIAASFLETGVAGVGFNLGIKNLTATLTTRFQAIEYLVTFTAGRQIADALGILANVSGAAGLFLRKAVEEVGGYDCEVAEDAALATKLRIKGWELRYAVAAHASTMAPETMVALFLQRLRWDASIVTIWWRKFGFLLNPFSSQFAPRNLLASLEVLVFSMFVPLVCPFYLAWLFARAGNEITLVILGSVMIPMFVLEVAILLLVAIPPRLLLYVPYYVVVQTLVMRPFRVLALVAELVFNVTKRDEYIPRDQRWRLT